MVSAMRYLFDDLLKSLTVMRKAPPFRDAFVPYRSFSIHLSYKQNNQSPQVSLARMYPDTAFPQMLR